jgi:hypothetical protein
LITHDIFRTYKTLDNNGTEDGDGFDWFWSNDSIHDFRMEAVFFLESDRLRTLILKTQGRILKRMLKQSVLGSRKVLVFPQNHRFYEIFNKKIGQLVTAGIINHLANDFKDVVNMKKFSQLKSDEVVPMSLEHLEAGFVIWLVSMIFPFVAFAFEWIVTLKDFMIFQRMFEAFVKDFENNARIRHQNMTKALRQRKSSKKIKSPNVKLEPKKNQTIQTQVNQIDDKTKKDIVESHFGEKVYVEIHEEPIDSDLIVTDL